MHVLQTVTCLEGIVHPIGEARGEELTKQGWPGEQRT